MNKYWAYKSDNGQWLKSSRGHTGRKFFLTDNINEADMFARRPRNGVDKNDISRFRLKPVTVTMTRTVTECGSDMENGDQS